MGAHPFMLDSEEDGSGGLMKLMEPILPEEHEVSTCMASKEDKLVRRE